MTGSRGNNGASRSSLVRTNRFERRLNSDLSSPPESQRPFHGRTHYQHGNRVEIICDCFITEPNSLEGDTSATGGRIENGGVTHQSRHPLCISFVGYVRERPRITVSLSLKVFSATTGVVNLLSRRHWVTVDTQDVQKFLSVSVRGQQRCKDRRPRRHQRPARPPHVEIVDGR